MGERLRRDIRFGPGSSEMLKRGGIPSRDGDGNEILRGNKQEITAAICFRFISDCFVCGEGARKRAEACGSVRKEALE